MIAKLIAHGDDARRGARPARRGARGDRGRRRHDEPAVPALARRASRAARRRDDDRVPHRASAALGAVAAAAARVARAVPPQPAERRRSPRRRTSTTRPASTRRASSRARSPRRCPGTVIKVLATPGAQVEAREPLVVLEAMKMETPLVSPYDATVRSVHVAGGRSCRGRRGAGRAGRVASAAVAVLLRAAAAARTWQPKVEGPYLQGKLQYWLVRPHGQAEGDRSCSCTGSRHYTGEQLVQWQKHLATEGYAVIFPREEQPSPDPNARTNVVVSAYQAIDRLGDPKVPLDHPRPLARRAASPSRRRDTSCRSRGSSPCSRAAINPFFEAADRPRPHPGRRPRSISSSGDRDDVVTAPACTRCSNGWLRRVSRPSHVHVSVIRSAPGFTATHDSVYRTDAADADATSGRASTS